MRLRGHTMVFLTVFISLAIRGSNALEDTTIFHTTSTIPTSILPNALPSKENETTNSVSTTTEKPDHAKGVVKLWWGVLETCTLAVEEAHFDRNVTVFVDEKDRYRNGEAILRAMCQHTDTFPVCFFNNLEDTDMEDQLKYAALIFCGEFLPDREDMSDQLSECTNDLYDIVLQCAVTFPDGVFFMEAVMGKVTHYQQDFDMCEKTFLFQRCVHETLARCDLDGNTIGTFFTGMMGAKCLEKNGFLNQMYSMEICASALSPRAEVGLVCWIALLVSVFSRWLSSRS